MFRVLDDPQTSKNNGSGASDHRRCLFRNPHKGEYGMDLTESEAEASGGRAAARAIVKEMDEEEESFAQHSQADGQHRITQEQLAERIGVGQPAISNMLNRNCRPQKKTIMKLATALNVSPTVLWPGVEVQQILDAIDRVQEDQVMSAAEAEALQAALKRPPSRIEVTRLPVRNRR